MSDFRSVLVVTAALLSSCSPASQTPAAKPPGGDQTGQPATDSSPSDGSALAKLEADVLGTEATKTMTESAAPPTSPPAPETPPPPAGEANRDASDASNAAAASTINDATGTDAPPPALSEAEAEKLIASIGEQVGAAIRSTDREEFDALLIKPDELSESIVSGYRSILGNTVIEQNRVVADRLFEVLNGRTVEAVKWRPGSLSVTRPGAAFVPGRRHISESRALVTVDSVHVVVKIDTLLEVGGAWKIFRVSLP